MNPMIGMINSAQTAVTPAGGINPEIVQAANQWKPLLQMLQHANNPTQLLQQLCMQNPAFRQAYQTAQSVAGGDPRSAFFAAAKQQGVDPNAVIEALRG